MSSAPWPRALVDGILVPLEEARLAVTDAGVARGDGAFETIGVWDGRPFRLDAHLERLAASLEAILLPAVDGALLRAEVGSLLGVGPLPAVAGLRIYVTGSGTRIVTLADAARRPEPRWLLPMEAPWIVPARRWPAASAKTMSYLPNMVASRLAQRAGADDALLVDRDGIVLEGPTFGVCWVVDGVLHAPALELGIIDSISRRTVVELAEADGIGVRLGAFPLGHLLGADEVLLSSAIRDLVAVARVGDTRLGETTPVRDRLGAALRAARHGRYPGAG